ncbi:unnamed protein product, partial [Acanthocheilonema viteae]
DETDWAPLPDDEDEEHWPSGAEWASLPDDETEGPEVSAARMEITSDEEPEEAVRELVLLWTLSLASTRFYGCAEDGGIGAA